MESAVMASSSLKVFRSKIYVAPFANSTTYTCLVSGIFLDSSNRRSVIVGAGYIAIEMAGILHTLGSDATLVIRKDKVS